MEFKKFLDYTLAVYYRMNRVNPKVALTPYWIVEQLDGGYNPRDVIDIMNSLGASGYLMHYEQKSGTVSAITAKGQNYFEGLDEKYKSDIFEYLEQKGILALIDKFKNVYSSEEYEKNKVKQLIDDIKTSIEKEAGIDKDILIDLNILKLELNKRNPDSEIVDKKVDALIDENILMEKARELKDRLRF